MTKVSAFDEKKNDHCFLGCKSEEYFTLLAFYHILARTLVTTNFVLEWQRTLVNKFALAVDRFFAFSKGL